MTGITATELAKGSPSLTRAQQSCVLLQRATPGPCCSRYQVFKESAHAGLDLDPLAHPTAEELLITNAMGSSKMTSLTEPRDGCKKRRADGHREDGSDSRGTHRVRLIPGRTLRAKSLKA